MTPRAPTDTPVGAQTDLQQRLDVRRLSGDAGSDFEALFSIYAEALPRREQKSRDELSRMLTDPAYAFLVAHAQDVVVGFAIVYVFPSGGGALLEYMAVDRHWRQRGLGAALFRSVVSRSPEPLLLEVEAPEPCAADNDTREHRQRLYRRLGCRRVAGLAYILPLPGQGSPPRMNLFLHAGAPIVLSRPRLNDSGAPSTDPRRKGAPKTCRLGRCTEIHWDETHGMVAGILQKASWDAQMRGDFGEALACGGEPRSSAARARPLNRRTLCVTNKQR
jgi:GNAT superfamily N-acetyltransferase